MVNSEGQTCLTEMGTGFPGESRQTKDFHQPEQLKINAHFPGVVLFAWGCEVYISAM